MQNQNEIYQTNLWQLQITECIHREIPELGRVIGRRASSRNDERLGKKHREMSDEWNELRQVNHLVSNIGNDNNSWRFITKIHRAGGVEFRYAVWKIKV